MKKLTLGKYYQDSFEYKSDLNWFQIDKRSGTVLLLAEFVLVFKQYDDNFKNKWEDTTLFKWLNNEFLKDAFDTDIVNNKLLDINFSSQTTTDNKREPYKVSLLSTNELKNLQLPKSVLSTRATAFAFEQIKDTTFDKCNACWWLRSDFINDGNTMHVIDNGNLHLVNVDYKLCGVRPIICLDIKVNS